MSTCAAGWCPRQQMSSGTTHRNREPVDYLIAVARRRRRGGRHRHRRRPRAAVLRSGERLEPVDAGRRPDDQPARCRRGADPCTRRRSIASEDARTWTCRSRTTTRPPSRCTRSSASQRVPVLAVKRKNAINEPLFTHPPETVDDLNPYARIIADEAMRRGIWVEVLDAEARRDAAVARRPQRHHPRVVVGVHLRGGDEPLRRQTADPAHRRRGRHQGAEGPTGHLRQGRSRIPRRGRRRRGQTDQRRAGQGHHRRRRWA